MKKSNVKKSNVHKTNVHNSKVKKSIDVINRYLLSLKENFQSDLKTVENDIERINLLISDAQNNKKTIESTFDSSYMILSSSQVAKLDEYAELDSFDELIRTKHIELDMLNEKKNLVLSKIAELDDVISCAKEIEGSVE